MAFKDWQQNARLKYYIGLSLHNCLKKPGKKKGSAHSTQTKFWLLPNNTRSKRFCSTYCFTGGDLTRLRQSDHRKITWWTIDATHSSHAEEGGHFETRLFSLGLACFSWMQESIACFHPRDEAAILGPKQKNILVTYLHENSVEFLEGSNCCYEAQKWLPRYQGKTNNIIAIKNKPFSRHRRVAFEAFQCCRWLYLRKSASLQQYHNTD